MLSADTVSEVHQLPERYLSLKPSGKNCTVLPYIYYDISGLYLNLKSNIGSIIKTLTSNF